MQEHDNRSVPEPNPNPAHPEATTPRRWRRALINGAAIVSAGAVVFGAPGKIQEIFSDDEEVRSDDPAAVAEFEGEILAPQDPYDVPPRAPVTPTTEAPAAVEAPATTTTTEMPPVTIEVPKVREVEPMQKIGVMSVEISGEGAQANVITHDLLTDGRTHEEVSADVPVDILRSNQVLDKGFMWHRDSYLPGWAEDRTDPENPSLKYPTIIAGHRVTDIQGSIHGSLVLEDIDKVQAGDRLTMTLDDGTVAVYEAEASEVVQATDTARLQEMFTIPTERETALVYGCHPKGQSTHRFFVHYVRVA